MTISQYSRHIDSLLNINNCEFRYSEINDTINSLYSDTINKKIRLINETDSINEYYDFQEKIPLGFIEKLLTKSGNSYIGYNKVNISGVSVVPENLLERVEEYYSYILTGLKSIRKGAAKDLYTFKRLNRLYFKFSHDNLSYLSNKNLFKYLSLHQNELDSSERSLVISLFLFLTIQPIYIPALSKITNDFKFRCFSTSDPTDINITQEELNMTTDDVYSGFTSYISDNSNRISQELSSFLSSNIFVLNDPSDSFLEDLSEVLSSFVLNIGAKFEQNIKIIETYQQTIAIKTMTSLAEYITINDIKTRKNYIDISQEENVIIDENYIYQKFNDIVTNNQVQNLISLEYIIYQFKDYPLYFLNSYFIAYNNYLNDILQDSEFLELVNLFIGTDETDTSEHLPNIVDWVSKINIDPELFVSNINSIDIFQEFENSKALEYNFTLYFINIISNFIDSDEFHELIVVELPKEVSELSNYIKEYKDLIINNIGRIKVFIKIFLIKEILDGVLFADLFSEFQLSFNSVNIEYDDVNIVNIVEAMKSPNQGVRKIYLDFVKGMFYSGHMSSFLNRMLDKYRL